MRIVIDYAGHLIRLTDERMAHILEHPEMVGMETAIEKTLLEPECVIRSLVDPASGLYYRYFYKTKVGDKFLCVVVKFQNRDAFVLTAYLTDRIKKGDSLWDAKP